MSAIVGIHQLGSDAIDPQTITRMTASLLHRGPDGSSVWQSDKIALGHCMLHSTPESASETLPLRDDERDLVLTCDARIDNRDELLAVLFPGKQASQSPIGDSALILAAYAKWGADCVHHLLGDFAFAIWDGRRNELFCARDHFGIKPFYYHHAAGEVFVFASEIKALFQVSSVPHRINETRIGQYLALALADTDATFYEEILRLPAAHTLTVGVDVFRIERYWKLQAPPQLDLASDAEYDERFRTVFFEAVRCRSRVPDGRNKLGGFLSGGIDSSAVMAVAREVCEEKNLPLPVISTVFDVIKKCDERPFMDAVIQMGGLQQHAIIGETRSALMDIEGVLRFQDEPFVAPNLCSSSVQYQAANELGVRVVLDGHGGDETIGYGHSRLGELQRAGNWRALWHELNAMQRNGFLRPTDASPRQVLWHHLVMRRSRPLRGAKRVSSAIRRRIAARMVASAEGNDQSNMLDWKRVINADFAARTDLEASYERWRSTQPDGTGDDRQTSERIVGGALQPLALETLDKAAAAAGVEARYPMWDKRLVEFCLSLPSNQKLRNGWSRLIIRRALEEVLPPEVQWRSSKVDFTAELRHGLQTHESARLSDLIENGPQKAAAYLDGANVMQNVKSLRDGSDIAGREIYTTLRAVCLEFWLRGQAQDKAQEPELVAKAQDVGNLESTMWPMGSTVAESGGVAVR